MTRTYHSTEARAEFYTTQMARQEGRCAICGMKTRLVIDHNHTTGLMRGLLCFKHNAGLGMFSDNPELFLNAITYLREHANTAELPVTKAAARKRAETQRMVTLMLDESYTSDRERARELAREFGRTYAGAQAKISRLRRNVRRQNLTFSKYLEINNLQ